MSALIPDRLPDIWFTVYGLPAPQGSKRHVGHGRLIESSKKVAPWRKQVDAAARRAQGDGWVALDGPLLTVMEFYLPRPKGHPKTRRTTPAVVPDISKLIRSTEDAMTTSGLYADDARITDTIAVKRYATDSERLRLPHELARPGAKIAVWRLDVPAEEPPLLDFTEFARRASG